MSSNLRANISLTTNILLVVGTFFLILKLTPIAKNASMENLCTEFNHLRFNPYHESIPYSGELTPEYKMLQEKRNKRHISLDKKITRLINLPYYNSKKEINKSAYSNEARKFCEFFNTEFFNIRNKKDIISNDIFYN